MSPRIHSFRFLSERRPLASGVLLMFCCLNFAQQPVTLPDERQAFRSLALGVGNAASLDTYLSPNEYSGPFVSVDLDRISCISSDSFIPYRRLFLSLGGSSMRNHAGAYNTVNLMAHGYYSFSHPLVRNEHWDCLLGASVLTDLGALYNSMNSNNPVNAQFQNSFGATLDNIYRFRLLRRPMVAKATVHLPLIGTSFAPDNDQLYWNMYQESDLDGNFHYVTPFSAQTGAAQVSLAIPLHKNVFQIGYDLYLMRNRLGGNSANLLHSYVTLGFVYRSEKLSWRQ